MALTVAQIAQLKTELQTDPRAYGYNAVARNDSDMQAKINLARDGTNIGPAIKIINPSVDTGIIRAAITKAAYDGLVTGDRSWLNWFTGAGTITVQTDTLQVLAGVPTDTGSIWSVATRPAMNAAMDALLRRNGSRAEELWGRGVVVTLEEIGKALN